MSQINDFLQMHYNNISHIIQSLPDIFDSHDLICELHFQNEHELTLIYTEYSKNKKKGHQIVNSLIAKFLDSHSSDLMITRTGKTRSRNVFGNITECEQWKKLK